jgi:molecular chaperone DnaK
MPQIEVSFDIDANGIVNVSAKDIATGKEQAMTITGGTALGKDEIDRMVKEAESFAAEDHKRREAAEARNQADQLVYQVEKFISDNGDKVPESDKSELSTATDALKEALKDQDADAAKLNAASESVMTVFSRVGQAMYQQAQASGAPETAGQTGDAGNDTSSSNDDEEVVEGEIVEEGGSS